MLTNVTITAVDVLKLITLAVVEVGSDQACTGLGALNFFSCIFLDSSCTDDGLYIAETGLQHSF